MSESQSAGMWSGKSDSMDITKIYEELVNRTLYDVATDNEQTSYVCDHYQAATYDLFCCGYIH